jgi:hypothetical protein
MRPNHNPKEKAASPALDSIGRSGFGEDLDVEISCSASSTQAV